MSTHIALDPALDPWERQPRETARKHGQLVTFRDLGRARTLTKAAEILTLAPGHVRNTASEYRWRERVEAWDRRLDRLYEATWIEERRKAAETDARILDAAIGKLAKRFPTLNPEDLTPADFIRLMDIALKHRRVLFGDPTETIVVTGQAGNALGANLAEFARLPDDQRRARLAELTASVTRRLRAVDGSDDDEDAAPAAPATGGDEDSGQE